MRRFIKRLLIFNCMIKNKGLIGKLNKISIGDVILLSSKDTNLSGYVTKLKEKSIKLSVEDPNKHDWKLRRMYRSFNPARWYDLIEFDSYVVLKKSEAYKQ